MVTAANMFKYKVDVSRLWRHKINKIKKSAVY